MKNLETLLDEQYDFAMKLHSDQEITKNELAFALNFIGNFKASMVGCCCKRPSSCGSCRTSVEDEAYWQEKKSELLDEALNDNEE